MFINDRLDIVAHFIQNEIVLCRINIIFKRFFGLVEVRFMFTSQREKYVVVEIESE